MTATKTLSENLAEQVTEVSAGIEASLKRHFAHLGGSPALSDATKKHIAKRVPPKTLSKYHTPENAISLLALEIEDLGLRISRYQFIERYREHFEAPTAEMRTAFVMHTHILRGSEIYIIMERCGSLLDFFYDLASDLSLNPTKVSKALETRFKKDFERHLRERHRFVLAHERPTLVSRMISIPPDEMSKPEVADTFKNVLDSFVGMVAPAIQSLFEIKDPAEAMKRINDFRLQAVDKECLDMWAIFLDSLTKLIDPTKLLKGAAAAP